MQERTDLLKVESEQAYTEDSKKSSLPDVDDVVSEWFSEEHPDRLQHLNWNKDHAQYREYHKTL
jgi:hypothetical protein